MRQLVSVLKKKQANTDITTYTEFTQKKRLFLNVKVKTIKLFYKKT